MKKLIPGLLLVALVSTGCLGDAPQQVLGQWRYATQVDPLQHDMRWNFEEGGQVTFYNITTGVQDTGTYEMFPDGTHNVIKIKGTDIQDRNIPMNGEWVIVKINYDELVVGTHDYGGFIQRDLYR